MKIRRFRENIESTELIKYNIFQDEIPQTILSKYIIEDYFSLVEPYSMVDIQVCIISSNDGGGVYINKLENRHLYVGEVCYKIGLTPNGIDREYYIDHGDSASDLSNIHSINLFAKILNELNSINKKIEPKNHSILIGVEGLFITCIVRNNDNKKISNI